MRSQTPSVGFASELDPISELVLEFEDAWRHGPPPLERFRDRLGAEDSSFGLAELIKADLQNRYRRGERPSARDYLDRFPELAVEDGHALSLIFDEYCLRIETEGQVDSSEFCDRYPTWRDSLVSQIAYHKQLARAGEPPPTDPEFPEPGDRFGDYELVSLIGRGGAARVFLARAMNLGGKEFVLKITRDRGSEPSILGRLDHPHIVPVLSSVVDPATGLRGLCMPYRPGLPLDRVLKRLRGGPLPRRASALRAVVAPAETAAEPGDESNRPGWSDFPNSRSYADGVAWLGLKLARALAHAHARGFFHRDVKPENVLITARDGPQLLDFNLAHDPDLANQARTAHRGGTLPYMAREHLQAFLDPALWTNVGAAADLFSLGLILRELLTGQTSWRPSESLPLPRAIKALAAHRAAPPVPIRKINPSVPHALEAILARCLAESPEARYPNAESLAEDLGHYLGRRPLRIARNPSRVESALNRTRKNGVLAAIVAATLGIGISLGLASTPSRVSGATRDLVEMAAFAEASRDHATARAAAEQILNRADAIPALARGCEEHGQSLTLRMIQGNLLLKAKRLDEAARSYHASLVLDASHIPALQGLAYVELQRDHPELAVEWLDKAIALQLAGHGGPMNTGLPLLRKSRVSALVTAGDRANEHRDYARADAFFARILEDLSQPDALNSGDPTDLKTASDRHILIAIAHSGRITSAGRRGEINRAIESSRLCQTHLDAARALGIDSQSLIDELELGARKRFEAVAPGSAPPL